jgi:flagellar L-ring protein precursor FlgH
MSHSLFRSRKRRVLALIGSALLLNGCSSIDRLLNVGEKPALSSIDNPTTKPGYKPVQMPMPAPQLATYNPNSLWRNGSRAFFKDQRAHQVGDILTVTVNINDNAKFDNETQRSRNNNTDSSITNFFGRKTLPIINQTLPATLLTANDTAASWFSCEPQYFLARRASSAMPRLFPQLCPKFSPIGWQV